MKSIPLKKIFLIFLPVLILMVFASCEFSFSIGGDDEVDETGESFQGLLKLDKDEDKDDKDDKEDVDEDKEVEEEATSKFIEDVVKGVVTEIADTEGRGKQESENPEELRPNNAVPPGKEDAAKDVEIASASSSKTTETSMTAVRPSTAKAPEDKEKRENVDPVQSYWWDCDGYGNCWDSDGYVWYDTAYESYWWDCDELGDCWDSDEYTWYDPVYDYTADYENYWWDCDYYGYCWDSYGYTWYDDVYNDYWWDCDDYGSCWDSDGYSWYDANYDYSLGYWWDCDDYGNCWDSDGYSWYDAL